MFPIDFHVSNQHPMNMQQQLTQNSRVKKKIKIDCAYANYVGGTHFFDFLFRPRTITGASVPKSYFKENITVF